MTTARGFGPLPQILAADAGRNAVRRSLAAADLPEHILRDPAIRLPMVSMFRLFERGGRETGDRLFGLRVGVAMTPGAYGAWVAYALSAPTLRAAIGRLSWGLSTHQIGGAVSLDDVALPGAHGAQMTLFGYRAPDLADADPRHHADHIAPTMLKIARAYLGAMWRPSWIGLPYADDGCSDMLSEALGTDVRFGAAAVTLPLCRRDLDRRSCAPIAPGVPTRSDVAAGRVPDPSSARCIVEDCIRLELLAGRTGIDTVAHRLDQSKRSLQRKLALEGTTFAALLDKVRREKAEELLRRPDAGIGRVAFELGYSDPSNFTRAYRRWNGHAPTLAPGEPARQGAGG